MEIILKGEGLSLGYKNQNKESVIAEGISFRLEKGKLTCLLGPNGVGKSTLIKTIMGQIPILKGDISFSGKAISEFNEKLLAKKIAVVLTEKVALSNLTVYQLVSLGRIPHTSWLGNLTIEDHEVVKKALLATNIEYLKDSVLSEISDGQMQKVMIARALVQDGEVVILDEPTAHLDLINRFEIMHLLRRIAKEEGKAILVVTHDLDIAIETADEFWLMQCGFPLVSGTPEDLIVSDKINLLLPKDSLKFDVSTGKVQDSTSYEFPRIIGEEKLTRWLKLLIRKNKLRLPKDILSLTIYEIPFTISIESTSEILEFDSFKTFLEYFLES
ncbi:ABC-type cobalamin/Fe3+-siderophore transport system, ATPase component [Belliella baltica DSM 15883]|uniref:ABC-type cobalamin/Fe3+-siderophore transport system, ATPase component n=1 Tax=Belliella baltica (strain DSM 15883 / CIP 108006 / LMG 21964 / BA134) TaxID=866536 RepID=I3ZAQ0_BELBD|nr:ABC transporter ATP-binding protein [Belliella baltica]AFL86318.1 ABC-type cobalamin/Fe3+-siderophore transport system, ATPase component [Belliella baltica DSM 15883]